MKKLLVVGVILLFLGSSIPALAQSEMGYENVAEHHSFRVAFIFGPVDECERGVFHFTVSNDCMTAELPLIVFGFDRIDHRFVFTRVASASGGFHIGFIGRGHFIAFNVTTIWPYNVDI
jgi:hypothetical protein